ncbi:Ribokinase-like protein [Lipomyces kononenkoae]|uniref:Ribokinase-like protein n=1 Tax=Lipomyces kononenkoae TaxID=34357 RepID=A0ACC3SVW9_LIPKO
MPHVTIFGSLNYDLVVTTERVPKGGETIKCDSFATHCGGKGANQALAVRRLSSPKTVGVRMVGRVGQDAFGQQLKAGLAKAGTDVSQIEEVRGESGVAVILVERSGENRILVNAGANGTYVPEDVNVDFFKVDGKTLTDYLVIQNELPTPVVLRAIEVASDNGIKIVYNPSPMERSIVTPEVISKISYLVVNESELAALVQENVAVTDLDLTDNYALVGRVEEFRAKYDFKGTVVTTFGGHGIVYSTYGSEAAFVQPFKVKQVVDTTGAGDSFLGAFVGALADGRSIAEAVQWGAAAGSLAVGRAGAADSIPMVEEARAVVESIDGMGVQETRLV